VPGNSFPHKQIQRATQELHQGPFEVIALSGLDKTEANIRQLKSGGLSQEFVSELYSTADVVVFPSAYEGFGLPMFQAIAEGKPLVVFDTSTAREVLKPYLHTANIEYFSRFEELPRLIHQAVSTLPVAKSGPVRTLSDYNIEVFRVLKQVASVPVDVQKLRNRNRFFQLAPHLGHNADHFTLQHAQLARRSVRLAQKIADALWGPIYQRRVTMAVTQKRRKAKG
jgi:hypothetical protein